ncbi:MAG TPA: DinB family protein [Acidimicrobiales bacterium]|nr:DinB family protein [Acidimicrobiales bacterium]
MDAKGWAREYQGATEEFFGAVALLTPDTLDRPVAGARTARQLVHYLTDAQAQGYVRLVRLLAEPPGSLLAGYDDAAWANSPITGYGVLPIEHAVALFGALRQRALDLLVRLDDGDLLRYADHAETGRYTLVTWLENYTHHPREYAAQLREAHSA